jgi:hypothetical protein
VHAGNLFLAAGASTAGTRRKAGVLEALAKSLSEALPKIGTPSDAVAALVEIVAAEAAQLRLKADGGWPWETFAAEQTIYRVQHSDAPLKSKMFRTMSMVPALLLPPRWFYAGREWLGSQSWYKRARESVVPVPGFAEVEVPGSEEIGEQ